MAAPPPFDRRPFRIGSRGSPLALAQTRLAIARLAAAWPGLPEPCIAVIKTTGDTVQDRPLAEIGGKGLFAKEIEAALLAREIDGAVHSLKDLETSLPAGIVIAAALPRADPRDALIAPAARGFSDLPPGAAIATGSVRRAAQVLALRPDLAIVPIRGNVGTRIARLRAGAAAATILAMAGLERLGLSVPEAVALDPAIFLPAAGQGMIAIECREDDEAARALLAPAADTAAMAAMAAERALLGGLDGSCKTPIGALAQVEDGRLRLDALVASRDGRLILRARREGGTGEAATMGRDAAEELRRRAPRDIFG